MGRTDEFCPVRPIVAFQGESGAFSEKAIEYLVEGPVKLLSCNTFDATTGAVVQGIADLGVIPVENLIAGPVEQVWDCPLFRISSRLITVDCGRRQMMAQERPFPFVSLVMPRRRSNRLHS